MSEDDPCAEITTSQNGSQQPSASVDSIITLIHSFSAMVQGVKADLLREMAVNADASRERWTRWESEFKKYQRDTDRRIEMLEEQTKILKKRHDEMDEKEQHDEIVWEGRVQPLRNTAVWLGRHARDIIIIILGILAVLGFSTQAIERIMGL